MRERGRILCPVQRTVILTRQVRRQGLCLLLSVTIPDFCGNPDTGEYTGDNSKSPAEPKRSITAEQFEHRMILRRAMLAHGFKPLDTEWWHFTLRDEPFPDTYFTFPVKKLGQ